MKTTFRIGGDRYKLMCTDRKVLHIIQRMGRSVPSDYRPAWLLAYRTEIAYVRQTSRRAAITLLALTTTDPHTRKLALWFRGRCGGALGAAELLNLALQGDGERRVHTARCLKKMGAWAQLRVLSGRLPNTLAARRFASPTPRRPFSGRLERFLSHMRKSKVSESPCQLLVCANQTAGKPAKPVWLIRLVLDRIRFLVSARYSHDRLPTQFYDDAS